MSSSFVPPERNVIPNQGGTPPYLPGNSGAADSFQPGGFKRFFSNTRNVVLLLVGIIVLGTVLGVGAGSGWFSGDSARRSDVPDTPPPDSTKGREEYETPHRALGDDRRDREEEGRWPLHREPGIIYGKKRDEGPEVFGPHWGVSGRKESEISYSSLITMLHNIFQNPNPDFDLLVEKLNENNVTKSSQLEQVISEYFKKYSLEGYSPQGMSPKIEKLRRFFNTDRTLEKQILKGIRFSTADLLVESLRNQNVLDSDVQSAVENLSSDYDLSGYQKKQLAEFDFSFRGQSSKSLYFDRMFDLYTTNYSDQPSENLFKNLSRFLDPSVIKEEITSYKAHYTLNPLMNERLISLEKMCRTAKMEVDLKKGKESEADLERENTTEVLRIITEVLNGHDIISYAFFIPELSKFPHEIIVSASDIVHSTRNSVQYFLSYLKYYFGHKSRAKHILEAIEIYTKGLTPNAVPNDLWEELRSHFDQYEMLNAIDELKTKTSQSIRSNPWFKFLEIKCGRLPPVSFPDIHQAILDHLKIIPLKIDPLALELVGTGKSQAELNTAISEFQNYEYPDKKTRDFLSDLLPHCMQLMNVKSIFYGNFDGKFRKLQLPERSEAIASWVRESCISRDPIWGTVIGQLMKDPIWGTVIGQLMRDYPKDFHFRLFLVDVVRVLSNLSEEQFLSEALSAFRDGDSTQELYTYLKSNLKNMQLLKDSAKSLQSDDKYKKILEALLGEISNESYQFDSIFAFIREKSTIDQKDFVVWFKNFQSNFSADIKKLINFADKGMTSDDKEEVKNLVLLIFSLLSLGEEVKIGEYWGYFTINYIDDYILPNAKSFISFILHDHENNYRFLKGFGVVTNKDCKEIADSLKLLKKKLFLKAETPKNPELSFPYVCSICLGISPDPLPDPFPDPLVITNCGHLFCEECTKSTKINNCPICRAVNPNPLPLRNVRVEKKDVEGKEEIKIFMSCSSKSCTKLENLKEKGVFTLICDSTNHTNRSVYCESCANNLLNKKCPKCLQFPSKMAIFGSAAGKKK